LPLWEGWKQPETCLPAKALLAQRNLGEAGA